MDVNQNSVNACTKKKTPKPEKQTAKFNHILAQYFKSNLIASVDLFICIYSMQIIVQRFLNNLKTVFNHPISI